MNGYCKMRVISSPTAQPTSNDSPPAIYLPSPSPPQAHADPRPSFEAEVVCQREKVAQCGGVGGGGVVRTCSSTSQRFSTAERGHGGLRASVKRAFSMRKPPSIAEGYWRIHDDTDDKNDDDDDNNNMVQQQVRPSRRRRERIFEVCKRLLRL